MKQLFPFIILLMACNTAPAHRQNSSIITTSYNNKEPYKNKLQQIDSIKKSCATKTTQQTGSIFSEFIDKQIFPYWYGTTWDYNGVTQTPNEGSIACGYFVTTVLQDAGVTINRVKQAQCASEQMINSLTTIKENYSKLPFNTFIEKVKAKGKGISIIGLDNHTGFLYFDGEELYFIHSSFVGEGKVAKEIASTNSILQNSNYKVVGYISNDKQFLQHWLK